MPMTRALRALEHLAGMSTVMLQSPSLYGHVARRRERVCRAIISSSLVGMTHAATRLAARADARAARAALAAASSSTPSHAASRHTRSRSERLFSPMPRGEHDRVEAAERRGERAELAADAVDEEIDRRASRRGSSLASSVRMSLEMPDTPSSPDCW